jgi:hypothetical protein
MALEKPHQHKEASAQSYPFVVSLSNHAFRRTDQKLEDRYGSPTAWFDRLTTNGVHDRRTTSGI